MSPPATLIRGPRQHVRWDMLRWAQLSCQNHANAKLRKHWMKIVMKRIILLETIRFTIIFIQILSDLQRRDFDFCQY